MDSHQEPARPASQGAPAASDALPAAQEPPPAVGVSENSAATETRSTAELASSRNKGRKKIKIEFIGDNRSRQVTFLKRKNGILKKAHELSILCGSNVAVVIFNNDNGKLYEYFNPAAEETFNRYSQYTGVSERRRSDVTELGEAKGTTDMPNDEPAAAAAAIGAARMSAIRHAHPEEYMQPAPGRRQLHPNVTVPAIHHHLQQHMPPPLPPILPPQSAAGSSSVHAQLRMPALPPADAGDRGGCLPPAPGQRPAIAHPSLAAQQHAGRALPFHVHSSVGQQAAGGQTTTNPFGLPALPPPAEHAQAGSGPLRSDFCDASGHRPPRDPKDARTPCGLRACHDGAQAAAPLGAAGGQLGDAGGLTPLYTTDGRRGKSFDAGGAFRHSIAGDLAGGRQTGADALGACQGAGAKTDSPPFAQTRPVVAPFQPASMGIWSGAGGMLAREPTAHPAADAGWASSFYRHAQAEGERMEAQTGLPPLAALQVYGGEGEFGGEGHATLAGGGQQAGGYGVQGAAVGEVWRPANNAASTEAATGARGREAAATEAADEAPDVKRAKKE